MWAEVELNEEMITFINEAKKHTETFDKIKELVITKESPKRNCSMSEKLMLSIQFQEIKNSAFNKILNKKKLNFPEGFVIERLLAKYNNEDYPSVEEHIELIKSNCSNNRKTKRENGRKITKLYNSFLATFFSNKNNL